MAVVDIARKALTLKIVYYGCAMGGKTTNLVTLHRLTDPKDRKGLVSIATNDDRTLFFDLFPFNLGQIGGLDVKAKLYTVPGQVHYETTRRQVLNGADGIVFVVDSTPASRKANAWALKNLMFNMQMNGLDPKEVPVVIQWNKRDLADAVDVETLKNDIGAKNAANFEAVATSGAGVVETFSAVLVKALQQAYVRHGKTPPEPERIHAMVDAALAEAKGRVPEGDVKATFEHRFDFDQYRDQQADEGRDRRVVDQDQLLTEAVGTQMKLAEQLEEMHDVQDTSQRRGDMMRSLSVLAPLLADPAGDALPAGVMGSLLEGAGRHQGSFLLFKGGTTMEERESHPTPGDPLNQSDTPGLGSLAYRLCESFELKCYDDLHADVFFGQPPPGLDQLASALIIPIGCDGLKFGSLVVYGRSNENAFDDAEQEYWKTSATLIGLSLHWRALRKKLVQMKA